MTTDLRSGALTNGMAAYAAAVASRSPTPGGGGVVGVVAALAAALGAMVCRFTLPDPADAGNPSDLDSALAELDQLRDEMLRLAEADAVAYGAYRDAVALPKGTDDERAARRRAMQAALVEATEVPLAIARASSRMLDLLETVAGSGNPHVRSDAEIGALLAAAALRGSLINVRGNAGLLKDASVAERYLIEARDLKARASTAKVKV